MATTVRVSPPEISRPVRPGRQYQEMLTISNIGEERYSYRVQPEQEYRAWIDPDPELCAINAHEERPVTLNLRPPHRAKLGVHRFGIAVINEDVKDDQAQVNVALRVPIPPEWWATLAAVILILLVLLIWLVWLGQSAG